MRHYGSLVSESSSVRGRALLVSIVLTLAIAGIAIAAFVIQVIPVRIVLILIAAGLLVATRASFAIVLGGPRRSKKP